MLQEGQLIVRHYSFRCPRSIQLTSGDLAGEGQLLPDEVGTDRRVEDAATRLVHDDGG